MRNILNKIKACYTKFEDWLYQDFREEIDNEISRQIGDDIKKLRELMKKYEDF